MIKQGSVSRLLQNDRVQAIQSIGDSGLAFSGDKLYRIHFEARIRITAYSNKAGLQPVLMPTGAFSETVTLFTEELEEEELDLTGNLHSETNYGETTIRVFEVNLPKLEIESINLSDYISVSSQGGGGNVGAHSRTLSKKESALDYHSSYTEGQPTTPLRATGVKRKLEIRNLSPRQFMEPGSLSIQNVQTVKGSRSGLNNTTSNRVIDFQSKLIDEMKRIEKRHKDDKASPPPSSQLNTTQSIFEGHSQLSHSATQARKQLETMLSGWGSHQSASSHNQTLNSRYETIKSLLKENPSLVNKDGRSPSQSANDHKSEDTISKKQKLDKIGDTIKSIEIIPADMLSNKETIEYEFSDNEQSEFRKDSKDNSTRKMADSGIRINQPPQNNQYSSATLYDLSQSSRPPTFPTLISQGTSRPGTLVSENRSPGALVKNERREPCMSFNEEYWPKETKVPEAPSGVYKTFLIILDQKFDLLWRIKRRSNWRYALDTIKSIYQTSIEKDKVEQSHTILQILAKSYYQESGKSLMGFMMDLKLGMVIDRFTSVTESAVEVLAKRSALLAIAQNSLSAPQNTKLADLAVKRILILSKTILSEKLYIYNHHLFNGLKRLSESKLRLLKKFQRLLAKQEGRRDLRAKRYTLHRLHAFSLIKRMVDTFSKCLLSSYLSHLALFRADRSFLACTASEITVKEESFELARRRSSKKFHLANYIGSHFSAEGSRRNQASNPRRSRDQQNTLEDIRHELSGLQDKKLEDLSAISRKSDFRNSELPQHTEKERQTTTATKTGLGNIELDLFEKAQAGTQGSLEEERDRSCLRNQAIQEKLYSIQLADTFQPEPPMDSNRGGKVQRDINFDTFQKQQGHKEEGSGPYVEPEVKQDYLKEEENREDEQEEKAVSQKSYNDERVEVSEDSGIRQSCVKPYGVESEDELQEANQDDEEELKDSQLDKIRLNLNRLEKIYKETGQLGSKEEPAVLNKVQEPSDDILWADKKFSQGFNFIEARTESHDKRQTEEIYSRQQSRNEDANDEIQPMQPAMISDSDRDQESDLLKKVQPKPPLSYTKTQESFRSFFKKAEQDTKLQQSRAPPINVSLEKRAEAILTLIQKKTTKESLLKDSGEIPVTKPVIEQQKLARAVKVQILDKERSREQTAKPLVSNKPAQLIERLQEHLKNSNQSSGKKVYHKNEKSEGDLRKIKSTSRLASSAIEPNQGARSKPRIQSAHSKEKNTSQKSDSKPKQPVKVRENSAGILPKGPYLQSKTDRLQPDPLKTNRYPTYHKPTPPLPKPSNLTSKHSDSTGRIAPAMKSVRSLSNQSDTVHRPTSASRIDNSNEGFKERYKEIRKEYGKGSYSSTLMAKKKYFIGPASPVKP